MNALPSRLETDTISEAIFEFRFQATSESAGNLLPGLIFEKLQGTYSDVKRLSTSYIPEEVTGQDPKLQYRPLFRLVGNQFLLSIGNRVGIISAISPYPGWQRFKNHIGEVLNAFRETSLIKHVERASVRYTNVIALSKEDEDPQKVLDLSVTVGKMNAFDHSFQLRSELAKNGFINLINIAYPAELKNVSDDSDTISGIILDIDTITREIQGDFWEISPTLADDLHNTEKDLFFSILSESYLKSLGPIYEAINEHR